MSYRYRYFRKKRVIAILFIIAAKFMVVIALLEYMLEIRALVTTLIYHLAGSLRKMSLLTELSESWALGRYMSSLDLFYTVLCLHNVIRCKVYACCEMLLEPWDIDNYTSGKSLQNILIFKIEIQVFYDRGLVCNNINAIKITFKNFSCLARICNAKSMFTLEQFGMDTNI